MILCPFLEIQSFSNFACFLRPMSVELNRERPFIWCFGEAPCIELNDVTYIRFPAYIVSFVDTDQWLPKTSYEKRFPTQFFAHRS